MSFNLALRLGLGVSAVASGGGGAAAPFASVNAVGWSVEYPSTPSLNPMEDASVTSDGYNSSGAPITVTRTVTTTQRVRQPYPNQASLSALTVACSDYIMASCVVSGATNNSTETVPPPIVNWTAPGRRLIGNTLAISVTGNHWFAKDGKPWACAQFTATDGVTTVTASATQMTASSNASDRAAVLEYAVIFDTTTLADGLVTVDCEAFPHVGIATQDSAANGALAAREFKSRVFWKNTALATAPNRVYLAAGGNDTTGYVGTDDGLAAASPCLTLTGAINRARTVLGTAAGSLNGLEIHCTEGTWSLSANPTANTVDCEVVIKTAAGAAKANTFIEFGASNFTPNVTYMRYENISLKRMGAFYPMSGTAGHCHFRNVNYNPNGFTTSLASAAMVVYVDGMVCSAAMGNTFNAGTPVIAMLRGLDVTASGNGWEPFLVLGCSIFGPNIATFGTRSPSNSIVQFNKFFGVSSVSGFWSLSTAGGELLSQISFSQNLVEVIHITSSTPALRPSSDDALNNLRHVLMDNISMTGYGGAGRCNAWYNETAGTLRNHSFCRFRNSIQSAMFHKGDWFHADGTYIGNWGQLYATGAHRNWTLHQDPSNSLIGQSEGLAYAGLGSVWGSSMTVRNDPLFVNYQGSTASAGAGNGDYNLQSGSSCIGMVPAAEEVFPFDLAGVARDRGSTGAYR